MPLRLRRSRQTLAVLSALLGRPQEWHCGYDLLRKTGLKSGTLYPIFKRLQRGGWLQHRWEKSAAPGRPPRHLYRLTRQGKTAARDYCAEANAQS
ncbi:MAG TPA: helix-turn-helix transcriptional regulator [Terriglobales bacterium]|nr:helix-turn-helix transcriptional regulator [Terriglobales bacterium]